jgi:cation diffusion facilitator family transporter
MKTVSAPADEDHPYGHGKIEYFSSAFEGGLIAFASLFIAVEAIRALFNKSAVTHIDQGMVLIVGAALANLALGLFLRRQSNRFKSEALSASAHHVLADVWTTVFAFAGLLLMALTGWWWIDGSVALMMAGYLGYTGVHIVRRSVGGLLDELEPGALAELTEVLESSRQPGIIDIHNLKFIRSGRFHHIDAHIVMPYFWEVKKAHQLGEQYEKNVVSAYPYDGEIAFHIDPCEAKYCKMCELEGCQVRKFPFQKRRSFKNLEITKGPLSDL